MPVIKTMEFQMLCVLVVRYILHMQRSLYCILPKSYLLKVTLCVDRYTVALNKVSSDNVASEF